LPYGPCKSFAEGIAVGVCALYAEGIAVGVLLARNALGRLHVSLYAEGFAIGVAMTPFTLRRPSTVVHRRSLRRGPPFSHRYCIYTPRVSSTPTVTRALPRELYADELRRGLSSA
jgi:hypothetical protein